MPKAANTRHGNWTVDTRRAEADSSAASETERSVWTLLMWRRSLSFRTFTPHFGHSTIVAWGTRESHVGTVQKVSSTFRSHKPPYHNWDEAGGRCARRGDATFGPARR